MFIWFYTYAGIVWQKVKIKVISIHMRWKSLTLISNKTTLVEQLELNYEYDWAAKWYSYHKHWNIELKILEAEHLYILISSNSIKGVIIRCRDEIWTEKLNDLTDYGIVWHWKNDLHWYWIIWDYQVDKWWVIKRA
jgi:hypothetical protein